MTPFAQPHHTVAIDAQRYERLMANPLLQACKAILQQLAPEATMMLVGGAVRDMLMGEERHIFLAHDVDVVVRGMDTVAYSKALADALDGHWVMLDEGVDGKGGVYRVAFNSGAFNSQQVDVTHCWGKTLTDDLARRDLSVNAMMLPVVPHEAKLLDPFNGWDDLQARRITAISEENIVDDPLRMLRVFRTAAHIDAREIDSDTLAWVTTHRHKVLEAAPERIHYEMLRLLSMPNSFNHLKTMMDCGLLEVILPEITPMREIPPNNHHHLWLHDHTLELVRQTERLLPTLDTEWQAYFNQAVTPACNRQGIVKLACLTHDMGKPATYELRDGKPTFYGHEKVSEEMSVSIGKRWKLSNEIIHGTKFLARWHLYPCQFGQDSPRKSVLRFFRRMGDYTPDILLLALADRWSTCGPEITDDILRQSDADHRWLLAEYRNELTNLKQPPLLTGHQIMEALNIQPGKQIGAILKQLEEAQQLGEVTTEAEAIAWLKKQSQNH